MHHRNIYRNRVRQCRLRALVASQSELARITGIDRTTISALENQRLFLSIHHALAIREALGCSLDDLYEAVPPREGGGPGPEPDSAGNSVAEPPRTAQGEGDTPEIRRKLKSILALAVKEVMGPSLDEFCEAARPREDCGGRR